MTLRDLRLSAKELNFKGLKISPIYQNWDPQDSKHYPLFKKAEELGIDSERWSGFAAGLGVERFCMVRHGVDDIRKLYTSDLRFLEQF